MNICIVADWLPLYAGAEHVIAEFHKLWPDAPIFTTIANHGNLGPLNDADIRTSHLQKWYKLLGKHHRILLPLMPSEMELFDLDEFDVILSSSHAIGKGIIPPSNAKHICYCHTPMRYAWEMERKYLEDSNIPKFFWKRIRRKLNEIRRWDMTTAKRVDLFIANSTTVADRIKKIYNRDSTVILPPVADRFFNKEVNCQLSIVNCYLALGRLVPYKRFDLLIECANKYNLPLKIAGKGPDESRLKNLAGPTVEFLSFVPDEKLPEIYANSKALLYPQEEDAGIAPLEAQSQGTPIIAFRKGGALDTIAEDMSGVFFSQQTVQSLKGAIDRFENMSFDSDAIKQRAEEFRAGRFRKRIEDIVS
ncbi:MAG: glycosyltransferase [Candidatus Peribacteraceae bacterium]|jgi:glycosyltransferase involved in cell wall biosynthesis|nr:glycosyltransferase [Candidatus Peribacteraceae bacterium]HCI03331.1 glycosyltransferase family 4 protein [Candidatus Peribacteria bacterium]|tara:strand:+ start:3914 stop:4999 length:1086 start_codon:yes stop_codon:yes gene_type:complete